MKTGLRLLSGWGFAILLACSDSHRDFDRAPTRQEPDASTEPPPEEPLAPPPSRELTEEEVGWADASEFEIELRGTQCYGTCPAYKMTLRSSGELRFTGYEWTWKPGSYQLQRTAAIAAELYRNIILRGFLALQPKYVTEADGCPVVWTDMPTIFIALRAGQREKAVEFYQGCEGKLDALDTMKAIEREIIELAELERYLEGRMGCYRSEEPSNLEPSYVLRDDEGEAIGLLRIELGTSLLKRRWSVTTCRGEELASAEGIGTWQCALSFLSADDTALPWPGADVPLGGVVMKREVNDRNRYALELHTLDSVLKQSASAGLSCD